MESTLVATNIHTEDLRIFNSTPVIPLALVRMYSYSMFLYWNKKYAPFPSSYNLGPRPENSFKHLGFSHVIISVSCRTNLHDKMHYVIFRD